MNTDNENTLTKYPWAVPFEVSRDAKCDVVWMNPCLTPPGGKSEILEQFSWLVPMKGSVIDPSTPKKTVFAERYGGYGIHNNGGGVRAAWIGEWIVKGTGINPLSGYSEDDESEFRQNGRMALNETIEEAIWGEVLHIALPYGAARMMAVLRTDESVVNSDRLVAAGVGVRQFCWRPAHFMRAHRFLVKPEYADLIGSDVGRVKAAIAQLPYLLPAPHGLVLEEYRQLSPTKRLSIGLNEMVRRFAVQMAAAKSKRLCHGYLTTSNICLDGRWNDLHSVTLLRGFGYRRIGNPFWEEQNTLISTISLLCFYISKYFRDPTTDPKELPGRGSIFPS